MSSSLKLIKTFHVYEEHGCFCPFCSDDTITIKFNVKPDRHNNGYLKFTYQCCNLILEHNAPNALFKKYLDNFFMGYLSNAHYHDLHDEIQKEIYVTRDKVILMLKTLMPLQDIYPKLIGSF